MLRRSYQARSRFCGCLVQKGIAHKNQGKYDEAIMAYDEVIQLNPKDAYVWHNKGYVLYAMGRYEEAIMAYDEAIRLAPYYAAVAATWNNKGVALKALGRTGEADAAFTKAKELRV
jgi:tetratricopeptide (TPR) repeat protein